MSTTALDPPAARRIAAELVAIGDVLLEMATSIRASCDRLGLATTAWTAHWGLADAASTASRAGTFLHLATDAVEAADTLHIDRMSDVAAGLAGYSGPPLTSDRLAASPRDGDPGETYDIETRTPYVVYGDHPADRGRNLVMRALADTVDRGQIRPDEFEVVQVARGRFVVVLPGVTDLWPPDPGLNSDHRTVRDTDRVAVDSAWSTSVGDNRYAQMVWSGLRWAGVPAGSELFIVGHSFGADTALDLVGDPGFNGDDYRVTHVVAAGYSSVPQLDAVPDHTAVLVLQNHGDIPVIAEALAQSDTAALVAAAAETIGRLGMHDFVGAAESTADLVTSGPDAVREIGGYLHDHVGDLLGVVRGVGEHDAKQVASEVVDLVTLPVGVRTVGDHAIVDVFDGGHRGAGHHPSNYVEHLAETEHGEVVGFLASLDDAGYAATGGAVAIDVSIPSG